jgi:hypothetical protein
MTKEISINAIEEVKVVGFDIYIFNSDGSSQHEIKDGLVELAKGELAILVDGKSVDVGKLVGTNERVLESLNNVFLENYVGAPSTEGAVSAQEILITTLAEIDAQLLEKEDTLAGKLADFDSKLQAKEDMLAVRLAEIAQIEEQLAEEKELTEQLQEDLLEQEAAQTERSEFVIDEALNELNQIAALVEENEDEEEGTGDG